MPVARVQWNLGNIWSGNAKGTKVPVCMYVCMYVCVYVCVRVCVNMYVRMYVCIIHVFQTD